ncbi:class I SAM-dependent RNA methyltransferase [Kocuria sp.]|uniref:class I SAM-dependent RNA methyltransferase n=1 Tax=Kocuria sp. TaxID=1871328 RepID=UPI0026E037FA|nr:TRAM domain-containing protein [Kocuria sp.]MDO5619356.1 TRAM domain-containing protein [Kocuria sp.]
MNTLHHQQSATGSSEAPELTVTPHAWAHGGHTVARTHDGRVVFVRHADVGERVRVRLTEHQPEAKFWRGDTVEVVEASPHRRQAHPWAPADALLCASNGTLPVGGAELGHLELPRQREIKTGVLNELLAGIGAVPAAELDRLAPRVTALPQEHPWGLGWRTRAHFTVTDDGAVAMYPHRSDQPVPVKSFPLMVQALENLHLAEVDLHGVQRLDLAAPAEQPEADGVALAGPLILVTPREAGDAQLVAHLTEQLLPYLNRVAPHASVVLGTADGERGTPHVLMGRGFLHETVGNLRWRVSAGGFWQIHRQAPAVLLPAITEAAQLEEGQCALDLYSGAGLFTAGLARAVGESGAVLAVEGSPVTSADAESTFEQWPQVGVRRGAVDRVLAHHWPDLIAAPRHGRSSRGRSGTGNRGKGNRGRHANSTGGRGTGSAARRPDVVVLDPPRAGAGKPVVDAIHQLAPGRVVYLSCDPATLARDLARFRHHGWQLEAVRGLDMYPNTHHLETLVTLVR